MSTETNNATTELANGAAPVEPGAVASNPQQAEANPAETPPREGEGQSQNETPEHRKANFRFAQLSEQRNKAQQEAAYWRGVAEASRGEQNAPPPLRQEAQPQAQADPEPNPEQYPGKTFDPSYLRDVAKWDGRQEARKLAEQTRRQNEESQAEFQQRQAFETGREKFVAVRDAAEAIEAEDPRLSGVTATLDQIARAEPFGMPGRLIDIVTNTQNPQWVAAALATKQGLLQQVASLDPVSRALEIGRIDAQISANLRAQQRTAPAAAAPASSTSSPAPSAPTLNGRTAAPFTDPNKMSMAEYTAWRNSAH